MERMWKEEAVAEFMVLFRHFPEGTQENHEILRISGLRAEI
jgi:hypothetical protein